MGAAASGDDTPIIRTGSDQPVARIFSDDGRPGFRYANGVEIYALPDPSEGITGHELPVWQATGGTATPESTWQAFQRGFSRGDLGVMETSSAATAGAYVGEFWNGTKQLGYEMSGAASMDQARANFNAGNYGYAYAYTAKAFADPLVTLMSGSGRATAGVTGAFVREASFGSGTITSTVAGSAYQDIVGRVPGQILSQADALTPGILGNDLAGLPGTFSGGRYATMQLEQPMTVYRAWAPGQSREFGAFWSLEEPTGSLQARIDSALLPEWGNVRGTPFNAQATQYTTVQLPAGTTIHIGEVGSQGSAWIGGKSQLLIDGGAQPAWKIGGGVLR